MKKRFITTVLLSVVLLLSAVAQQNAGLFRPLNWEEAGRVAAGANRLVLVEVSGDGRGDARLEKKISGNIPVMNFLQMNTVAIRVGTATPQGAGFAARLLMHQPPLYAFFLPYGDLLATVSLAEVAADPVRLVETGRKALEVARVKKSNSRTILFAGVLPEEAFAEAARLGKTVFIDLYSDNQASLLMEEDVFNLDRVADFYNRHFISLRVNAAARPELAARYGVGDYPAFLFLNGEGKLLYKAGGYCDADIFLEYGRKALEKAKGVNFVTEKDVNGNGKMTMTLFCSLADGAYKEMAASVFTDPDVAELLNGNFVNLLRETDNSIPLFVFKDTDGREVHRFEGKTDIPGLIREVRRALDGRGLAYMIGEYGAGQREPGFTEDYIATLDRAGKKAEAARIAMDYLGRLEREKLKEKKYWDFFVRYATDPDSDLFRYIYAGRAQFAAIYGAAAVDPKLTETWRSGAMNYVREEGGRPVFDEVGFKAYVKRMKKEKVKDWRMIARDGRMEAAGQMGDWRTYVELAEEKWNEEEVPDAELYSWGLRINRECRDEAIRFKAARWFALAVEQMERKEQQTGKPDLSSYKGFFKKLVNDLIGSK